MDNVYLCSARKNNYRLASYTDIIWIHTTRTQIVFGRELSGKYTCRAATESPSIKHRSALLLDEVAVGLIDHAVPSESASNVKYALVKQKPLSRKDGNQCADSPRRDKLKGDIIVEAYVNLDIEEEFRRISIELANLGMGLPMIAKCLPRGTDFTEQDFLELVSRLKSLGMNQADLVGMFTKDPTVLTVDPIQVSQLLQFGIDKGVDKGVLSKMCLIFPSLLHQKVGHITDVFDYLTSVGISKDVLIKILAKRPEFIGLPLDRLETVVKCLLDADIQLIDLPNVLIKSRELFSPTTAKNLHLKLDFLQRMGLTDISLGKALARRPNLVLYSLDSMKANIGYLETLMKPPDLPRLVRRYAEVLVLSPTKKLYPMIAYLLYLGVRDKDIRKVLLRRPQLLGYTVQALEPTVEYLVELGVKRDMIGKVVTTSPQVLTLNLEEKLKPVVKFLHMKGLDKPRDMERVLVRNAQILCCSIEKNLESKFEYLITLGLDQNSIANMIVLFPSMLGQSIQGSLAPKYEYLVKIMGRSIDEVIRFPQFFGYSLENRIKPRHEKLSGKGIETSLASMLACVDQDFEQRYMLGKPPKRGLYCRNRKV